jgi:hypothetical protein
VHFNRGVLKETHEAGRIGHSQAIPFRWAQLSCAFHLLRKLGLCMDNTPEASKSGRAAWLSLLGQVSTEAIHLTACIVHAPIAGTVGTRWSSTEARSNPLLPARRRCSL